MADETAREKARLRRALLARRREDAKILGLLDGRIREHLFETDAWAQARTLFCYVSVGWEIDTLPILEAAFAGGKRVCVPRCLPGGVMRAHLIPSLSALRRGALGIPEPPETLPEVPPEEIDLALVPAVAFDRTGCRMGRGGGYYDRFLPRLSCPKVGLCYRAFLLSALPAEDCDVPVDRIITEEGEIVCR